MESSAHFPANDVTLLARIATMRTSVRNHKRRAIEMWNACAPAADEQSARATMGKFTQQLAQCE